MTATADPRPDRRPVLRVSRCRTTAAPSWSRRTTRTRCGSTARVLDGAGDPVPDALLELWQADPDGRVSPARPVRCGATAWPSPAGAGRPPTETARYVVHDRSTPVGAPFFALTVFARGLLNRLFTRAYLPDARGRRLPARASTPTVARPSSPPPTSRLCLRHPATGRRRDSVPRPRYTEPMTDLFWPGDERAGAHLDERVVPRGHDRVEAVWLASWRPASPRRGRRSRRAGLRDVPIESESGGNPAIGLVKRCANGLEGDAGDAGCTAASRARTSSTPR